MAESRTHKLIYLAGGPATVARVCGVRSQAVSQWISQDRVPLDRCELIERATKGLVTCEQLRPDVEWVRGPAGEALLRPAREAA